ncbi:MAG: EamA family transporter, partial [Candidatus Competibacterales bacterium]
LMIRHGEATKVVSYFYLVPLAAAFQGWLFFGEQLGMGALAGMAVAVAVVGVYWVQGPRSGKKVDRTRREA